MRTGFELKLVASNWEEAKSTATAEMAKFLQVSPEEVSDKVDMELKISYPKAETITEIEESMSAGVFQVTVFASIKNSVAKPFGA